MGKSTQVDQVRDAVTYGALGFGTVAIAAPKVFAGIYGLKGDSQLMTMIRLWGTAVAGIGGISMMVDDEKAQRAIITTALTMNCVNAVAVATSGPETSKRSKLLGVLTSLGFAGAAGYVLSQS
ncbi:MAG TPA: hypothetical protein VGH43_10545 [Jatrophihabitans sp.]|jgi:hypothetical protein